MSRESGFICENLSHDGFTNKGAGTPVQWWVCAECGKPRIWWLQAKGGDKVLNFFRGGHLDGQAYLTSDLLHTNALPLRVHEYDWTPEVIVSEKTGASARVWVFCGE